MSHDLISEYAELGSPVHRLDARTKLVAGLLFIILCVSTPARAWGAFAGYVALLGAVLLISRVPPLYVLRRSLVVLPLVALGAIFIPLRHGAVAGGGTSLGIGGLHLSHAGLLIVWNVAIKSWIGILTTILLTTTTGLPRLMQGLEQLGAPRLLVMLAGFTWRYLYVLADEARRMRRALTSRGHGGSMLWHCRMLGQMIGMLFLRGYERSERIHQAMVARGFAGRAVGVGRTRLAARDYLAGALLTGALILLRVTCV